MEQKSDKYNFSKYRDITVEFESEFWHTDGNCNKIKVEAEAYFDGDVSTSIRLITDLTANYPRSMREFPPEERKLIREMIREAAEEFFYT